MVIPLNATEVVYSVFTDSIGSGLTGASPSITIRRKSDGYYWDFNDSTFKASGWTRRVGTMTEVDATNDAGLYSYSFDTTGLTEDTYFIRTELAASASPVQVNELQVGYEAESISSIESDVTLILEDTGTTIPAQISGLNDISPAEVNTEVDTALADYDAPTKSELDAGFAALNDLSAAEVNAEVDIALAEYDAPTKAELDTAVASLKEHEIMLNAVYDGSEATFEVWFEIEGERQTSVSNAVLSIYRDGTLQFSLNQASPNALGVFTMRQTTSLTADESYIAVCQLDFASTTYTTNKGLVTIDLNE